MSLHYYTFIIAYFKYLEYLQLKLMQVGGAVQAGREGIERV